MKVTGARKENGQVLIIIVVGLIGLIGFAALAIDGGMALSDRRNDQNGADAAALAGANAAAVYMENQNITYANFACPLDSGTLSAASTGAITRALDNHFTIVAATAIPQSNAVWVENCIKQPFGTRFDVHVRIATTTRTSLIQLFYGGPVINTVDSVARVVPRHPIGYGAALASLSDKCNSYPSGNQTTNLAKDGGIYWTGGGSGQTIIRNGGIFSNSCLSASGHPIISAYSNYPSEYAASGTIAFHWPTATGLQGSAVNFDNTNPYPIHSDDQLEIVSFSPKCNSVPNRPSPTKNDFKNAPGQNLTIYPGNYKNGISVPPNVGGGPGIDTTLTLAPGLYCISGDFSVGGKIVQNPPIPSGNHEGITIVMEDGSFIASGSPEVHLYASNMDELNSCAITNYASQAKCAIKGLLIYSPIPNLNKIDMGGTGSFSYFGTVYAPNGWVNLGGSNDVNCVANGTCEYGTEIIAWVIVLNGTNSIDILYNPSDYPTLPATLSQYK